MEDRQRGSAGGDPAVGRETRGFQAEVRQLLHLMINSLYSNRDIFLRELISNASDAADKLRFAALSEPGLLEKDADLGIRVEFNAGQRILSVVDRGIGMSRQEVIDNIGTIARSGTAEFLKQMTGDARKDATLIGQFGVGFYSAFIVADRVIVETRRAGLSAGDGVRWESDGQGEYTIEALARAERGTRVTLHLKEREADYCDAVCLRRLIHKYSDHIGFPVLLADMTADTPPEPVNSATALWTRTRSEIRDNEYREFYKHLTHDIADPLVWSHNRVEGKRQYTSLLFVPSRAPFDLWNREAPRGLKLYVQRVFIMDNAEQFLPLCLRFVRGVVDSADIPLNVSRELLQQDPRLDAMRNALVRRVLDMLDRMALEQPEDYRTFWREFGAVLKEGIVEDPQHRDRLLRLLRFATTHGESGQERSLDEYLSRAGPKQQKIYYLLGENYRTASVSPQLEQLRAKGIEVLLLTDRIDPFMVEHLSAYGGKAFQDVGRGTLELPEGDGELSREALNDEHKPLLKKLKQVLKDRVEAVNVSQRLTDSPACVVTGEQDLPPQLRRLLKAGGQVLPESKPVLEINVKHPLIARLSAEPDGERFSELANVILDQAVLAEGGELDNPAEYVRRVNRLLLDARPPPAP
ncbi:MAG: molecular chaperone HtpG [Woeseiaceae bacterium]